MKEAETIELLALVKGCWQEQATDRVAIQAWTELLAPVTYAAAREAVMELARSGHVRPSAAEVYKFAADIDQRMAERERASRKRLEAPRPSPAEIARVRQGIKALMDNLAAKRKVR